MRAIYNDKEDILLVLNPTDEPLYTQEEYKSTIKVDFNFNGVPIMMEIIEASVLFGMPKSVLKALLEER
jgi:hypothetical protein